MSNGTIDLRGNTNFVVLKNLLHQNVVPRTNLAAVDMTVANGLAVTGSTLYVNLATTDDIQYGTIGSLVDAATLKVMADSKAPSFTVGDLLENTNGTLNRKRYMDIISDNSTTTRSITPVGETAAVTAYVLEPGNAYKLHVASADKWLATTAAFKASSETWGIEGHIELFVAGTGYVRTDDNVVLTTPLTPDAVNNCVIRFHDGQAHISVEDTVAGYIVVMASGTSNGSLYYGLANNVGEYISVNDMLAGTTIDLGGVTTYNGEKHVVGNGYSDTIVGGTVACANKTTFSNLSLQNVVVNGGTLTLGDARIPSGSTVAVSGGGLAVEKVTGAGDASVINLGGTNIAVSSGTTANISSVTLTSGYNASLGGAIFANSGTYVGASKVLISGAIAGRNAGGAMIYGSAAFVSCSFSGNSSLDRYGIGGALYLTGSALVSSCTFADNFAYVGRGVGIGVNGSCTIRGCVFGPAQDIRVNTTNAVCILDGTNTIDTIGGAGSSIVSSGAVITLTSSIAPGGGIQVVGGACTVNGVPVEPDTYTSIVSSGGSAVINK